MKTGKSLYSIACAVALSLLAGEAAAITFQALPMAPLRCRTITADRVFDGTTVHFNAAVVLWRDKVLRVGPLAEIGGKLCGPRIDLGNATIMPGFIESHAHLTFQNVNPDVVLRHGITTVRDVGGPLMPPKGGNGQLRLLSAGPIIQAPGGYPLNVFGGTGGYDKIGIEVTGPDSARDVVRQLVAGGAAVIKIALEPGGEAGAPWMNDHGGGIPATPWPMLDAPTVAAIVDEAHKLGKRVTAHIGETAGATLALNAGVDEWAHVPCGAVNGDVLHEAVHNGVKFVSTIDTMASCPGIYENAHTLSHAMQEHAITDEWIYGSEIAHDNVPWGINGEELHLMLHLTSGDSIDFGDVLNVLQAATSRAGANLGIDKLGTLQPTAPADLIAVKGNALERFKILEYPDMVFSGGWMITNGFSANGYKK